MSSASSAVTYTSVYTNSEPGIVFWGADEELSDGGSPRVIVYRYNGLPMLPNRYTLSVKDEHILSAKEQPLPLVVSPTAESLGYVAESDPEEDPEEYKEDETKDGPIDYPMDGGDNGNDDNGNSSGYDADDEDEDEEEEEHLASANSAIVILIDELVSPPKGTQPTIPPPSTDTTTTGARISIRLDGIPKSEQPPRKRLCLSNLVSRYKVGESSTRGRGVDYGFVDTIEAEMRHRGIREVGYGIKDTWIDLAEAVPEMAPTTLEKVNTRVIEFAELHEHDTQDLYALLEDAWLFLVLFASFFLERCIFMPFEEAEFKKEWKEPNQILAPLPGRLVWTPVNGPYCQGCTLLREKLEEDLVTYFQNFQNTFESSDGSTIVVNAPREPFVFKQDHGVNPPHIDECCCECGDALDGIFCQQCTCKSCGKGAHIGYNCPPKFLIISNPEPCNQTMNNELPQILPSFDPTCYSDKENSVPCVSKPNFVDESSNIFNPPPSLRYLNLNLSITQSEFI
nr:hypothetical protein [Tanacetum cinerariifolium]